MKQKTTNTQTQAVVVTENGEYAYSNMREDVKNSLLVLSLIVNLYILTTWLVLQVTTQYDSQVYSFLFNR